MCDAFEQQQQARYEPVTNASRRPGYMLLKGAELRPAAHGTATFHYDPTECHRNAPHCCTAAL